MNYVQQGKGSPVILIHGLADTCHDWDSVMPGLAKAGFCAYAPDLPGHGDSPPLKNRSDYTIDHLVYTFETWLSTLDFQQPFDLIGHSLGGYVCLEYAIRHPRAIRRMVAIDPLFSPRQIFPVINNLLRRTNLTEKALKAAPTSLLSSALRLTPLVQAPIPPHLCKQKAQDFKKADPAVMRLPASIRDLTPDLKYIHMPTYVIWGKNDITLNPAFFPELVKELPLATGLGLEGTGHQPHIQRPEYVLELILKHLTQR